MKMKALILVVIATVIYAAVAFPQVKDGEAFSMEAINQAYNTRLIPENAQIQGVQESYTHMAVESIPGDQHINLQALLANQGVPQKVIESLQQRIDQVGRN